MSFLFDCLVLLQRHFWNVLEYIHFLSHWMSISFSPLSLSLTNWSWLGVVRTPWE